MIFDVRNWSGGGPDVWNTSISNAISVFVAVAFVVDPESPPEMGRYPEAVDRLLIPFRVFSNEPEALAFLRRNDGEPVV